MRWLQDWLILWLNNVIKDSHAFYVLCSSQPVRLSLASSFHVPNNTGTFLVRTEQTKRPRLPKKSSLGINFS